VSWSLCSNVVNVVISVIALHVLTSADIRAKGLVGQISSFDSWQLGVMDSRCLGYSVLTVVISVIAIHVLTCAYVCEQRRT
jgi:hypothetical protein